MRRSPPGAGRAAARPRMGRRRVRGWRWHPGAAALAGHHQDPVVHPDHVHVLAVQVAEHVGADHLVRGPGGGLAAGQVDDAVHEWQQRVHVVRRDQHRDALFPGHLAEQADHVLLAGDIQVGQRLVEQQQPGAADQRVRNHHPLLFAAGQVADPGVGEPLRADRTQHLVHQLAPPGRRQREAEPLPVQAQPDQVAGAQRHVRVESYLLRYVADQPGPPGPALAGHPDGAAGWRLQPENHLEQGGLARPVGADQAGELALAHGEADVAQDLPATQPDVQVLDTEHVGRAGGRPGWWLAGHDPSFWVDTWSATARCSACTSASIQDW